MTCQLTDLNIRYDMNGKKKLKIIIMLYIFDASHMYELHMYEL